MIGCHLSFSTNQAVNCWTPCGLVISELALAMTWGKSVSFASGHPCGSQQTLGTSSSWQKQLGGGKFATATGRFLSLFIFIHLCNWIMIFPPTRWSSLHLGLGLIRSVYCLCMMAQIPSNKSPPWRSPRRRMATDGWSQLGPPVMTDWGSTGRLNCYHG